MSRSVHLQVTIPAAGRDGIRQVAKDSLSQDWALDFACDEADKFLNDLSTGHYFFDEGRQGNLILWGTIGNWTDPKLFVETLKPFWNAVLSDPHLCISHSWQRIVVLYEIGQHQSAEAIEIAWDDDESADRMLKTNYFTSLPFSWNTP